MPWGYDPIQWAQLTTDIMSRTSDRIGAHASQLGQHVASGITKAVEAGRADELQRNQANQARNDLVALLRVAQEYDPNVAAKFAQNGIGDPVEAIPPPPKEGDLSVYLDQLAKWNTSLGISLARNPKVDKAALDRIMGMPGWSDKSIAAMDARGTMLGYQEAGTKLAGIGAQPQSAAPAPATQAGMTPPQPGGAAPAAGPTTQVGPTANPNPTVDIVGHLQPPSTQAGAGVEGEEQGQGLRMDRARVYADALARGVSPDIAEKYAGFTSEPKETTYKDYTERAKLLLRNRDLTQKDARLALQYRELAYKDAWQRANQIGEDLNIVDRFLKPDLYEIVQKRAELEVAPPPMAATPEEQAKLMKDRQATIKELASQEADLVKQIAGHQERAVWAHVPTGEKGQARLYGPTQLSNMGYGGSAEPQAAGPTAPETTPEWMGPDVGALPGGNASSMGGTRTERSSSVSAEISRPAPKKKPAAKPAAQPAAQPAPATPAPTVTPQLKPTAKMSARDYQAYQWATTGKDPTTGQIDPKWTQQKANQILERLRSLGAVQ